MPDASSKQLDVLVSGLIICGAARCLRVAFLWGTELSSLSWRGVLPVFAGYLTAFVLTVVGFWILAIEKPRIPFDVARIPRWVAPSVRYSALSVILIVVVKQIVVRIGLKTFGTDGVLFSQYATDLVLAGQNPYAASMAEAYARYNVNQDWATFRIDGSLVTTLSYPAMSVITYLPQAALHIPNLDLTTLVLLAISLVLLVWRSPTAAQWLPFLMLSANWDIVNFSGGGVFDAIWLLPVLLAMLSAAQRRVFVSGLFFGWACAAKQTPWLAAPFLLVFFIMERGRVADGARFSFGALASFAAVNLPFVIADPHAWFSGCLTPLAVGTAPLIEHGTGTILLNLAGLAALPKSFFGNTGLLVLAASAIAYACFYTRLRWLAWAAPMLALWFNYRSLQNYFVFYMPIAYLGVVLQAREAPVVRRPRGPIAAIVGALSVLAFATYARLSWRAAEIPGSLTITAAADPDALGATNRLTLSVHNSSMHAFTPVFSVLHRYRIAPMIWRVIDGPPVLDGESTARYTIEAPAGTNGLIPFDSGTHLRAYAAGTEHRISTVVDDLRAVDPAPGDHRIINPGFTTWKPEREQSYPYGWKNASVSGRDDVHATWRETDDGLALDVRSEADVKTRKALALSGLAQTLKRSISSASFVVTTDVSAPCAPKEVPLHAVGIELRPKAAGRLRYVISECEEQVVNVSEENDVTVFLPRQTAERASYSVTFDDVMTESLRTAFSQTPHPTVVVFAGVRPGSNAESASAVFHSVRAD